MGGWWPEYTSPSTGVANTRQFIKACTMSVRLILLFSNSTNKPFYVVFVSMLNFFFLVCLFISF